MQGLRAVCLSCGHTFEIPNIRFGGGEITLAANLVMSVPCEKCGKEARVPSGTYTVIDDALHHLDGQTFKRVQVDRLRAYRDSLLAKGREAADTIPDEVITAVSSISPAMGASIKLLKEGNGGWILLILLLHLILSRCDDSGSGGDTTINNDMRTEIVHHHNVTNVTNIYNLSPPTLGNTGKAKEGEGSESAKPACKGPRSEKN